MAFIFGRNWVEGFFERDGGFSVPAGGTLLLALGILTGILVLLAGVFFLSWWFTRYQVTDDHVRVHSGIVFRQQRQARIDRVQAIDIVQPLLARLFGLAELRFEVADAGESAVRLAFLKLDDAQHLRATILDSASGVAAAPAGTAAPEDGAAGPVRPGARVEAPEQDIVALSGGRVVAATLLSGTTLFLLAAAVAVAVVQLVTRALAPGSEGISLVLLLPVLFGVASGYWVEFSTSFNFRASVSRDGIRVRYGLLDTRAQTIPPGRVQAVSVTQSPLWRLTGWYRVSVNVAGYGAGTGNEGQARTKLLPAGTLQEVFQVLALVLPDPGTPDPMDVFTAGITGRDGAGSFTTTPRRARWIAPLAWRRNGFALTDTAVLVRSGAWWRVLSVVPHARTQSLALQQGPLLRRFGTSDVVLHSTPGPVRPRVRKLDNASAWHLFREQAVRAGEARQRDQTHRWLQVQAPAPETTPVPAGPPGPTVFAGPPAPLSPPAPANQSAPPFAAAADPAEPSKESPHEFPHEQR